MPFSPGPYQKPGFAARRRNKVRELPAIKATLKGFPQARQINTSPDVTSWRYLIDLFSTVGDTGKPSFQNEDTWRGFVAVPNRSEPFQTVSNSQLSLNRPSRLFSRLRRFLSFLYFYREQDKIETKPHRQSKHRLPLPIIIESVTGGIDHVAIASVQSVLLFIVG